MTYSDVRSGEALAQARVLDLAAAAPGSVRPGDAARRAPAALRTARTLVSIPALCGYGYLALGLWLALGLGFHEGDALSRTANGMYVVAGRDPHVAAIGFVWNPLPSIVQIPLVLALDPFGLAYLAGPLHSALFAVLTLAALGSILRMLDVGTWRRSALLLLYGLNPMIVFYAANGMSESLLLFFMVAATHELIRWTHKGGYGALITFALLSAGTFLVRYEGIAFCAGGAFALVVLFLSGKDLDPDRLEAILLTYLVPVTYVVALWIFFNAILVGDPLYFYRSGYGNLAQTSGFRSGQSYLSGVVGSVVGSLAYAGLRWSVVMPAIVPIAAVAFVRGPLRREWPGFAVLAVAGTLPAFHTYLLFSGTSFGWLRFFLYSIPFAFVLLPLVLEPLRVRRAYWVSGWATAFALLLLAFPTSLYAMAEPDLGREETGIVQHLIWPDSVPVPPSFTFAVEKEIAAYVDAQPPGSVVLMDSALAFGVNVFARDHGRFAITSDRDFKQILDRPESAAITHILVPNPRNAEAVGTALPGLWQAGASYARIEKDFGGTDQWRLYRMTREEGR